VASEFYFPAGVGVQDEIITPTDDASVVFRPAFARGAVQVQSFGGPRLKIKRTCLVQGADRGELFAFLWAIRGKQQAFWTAVNYQIQGSFPGGELLLNPNWASGIGTWSSGSSYSITAARKGRLRSTRTNTTASVLLSQSSISFAAAAYMVRGVLRAKVAANAANVRLYMENGSTYSLFNAGTSGIMTTSGVSAGGSKSIGFNDVGTGTIGDTMDVTYVTVQRCALINGGSQTGSAMTIDNLPASTAGLALAGDLVEVNRQIVTLVADLDSDGSGNGYLQFEPEVFSSPPDNDPVVFGAPMGKFILASDPQITNQYGLYANVSFDMEQVY